jgi:GNAT superfamily N-acetyltransferase
VDPLPRVRAPTRIADGHAPAWIREIQRRRAEAIFDDGLRPAFHRDDGTFDDPDPHDLLAYHLLQPNAAGVIVGGVRAAPLEALPDSRVRRHDRDRADELLRDSGLDDSDVLEVGRLWLSPPWRGEGWAPRLLLGTTALATLLGRRLLWCTVGARNGVRLLEGSGWRLLPEFGTRDAPELADTLRVAVTDPNRPPASTIPTVTALVDRFRAELDATHQSELERDLDD